ncbi:hypothetical protein HDU98_008722 [Podochytrium sp. JEL0797]|nr:hypothetical protein HDU98_008722 [Podochytrium sp. JEL0797]
MTTTTTHQAAAAFALSFDTELDSISALVSATEATARLAQLEKRVADAQLFLPAYDLRRCQQRIADVSAKLTAQKNKSRSKFSFSSKAKATLAAHTAVPSTPPPPTPTPINPTPEPTSSTATVFSNLQHTILRPLPTDTTISSSSSEVLLTNLSHCLVDLRSLCPLGAVHIKNASHCVILCGGIQGSVLIDDMTQSVLVSACRQFRMHTSTQSRILLHVSSKPIIEDCQSLIFGPYDPSTLTDSDNTPSTPSWREIVTRADLGDEEGSSGRWAAVEDFNWLRKGESPNWRRVGDVVNYGVGGAENVVTGSGCVVGSEVEGLNEVLKEAVRVRF